MSRKVILISDLSSCDFICDSDGIRIKKSSAVIDSSDSTKPVTYTVPNGTVPSNLKEGSVLIEIFSDATAVWTQLGCDESDYQWDGPVLIPSSVDTNTVTFYVNDEENSCPQGTEPNVSTTLPTASLGDTITIKYDSCVWYGTHNGTEFVKDFSLETHTQSGTSYVHIIESCIITSLVKLLTAPTTPPTNPVTKDTVTEVYYNYVVVFYYNGTTWTQKYYNKRGEYNPIKTVTDDYYINTCDKHIIVDTSSKDVTVYLPVTPITDGSEFRIKCVDITNTATIASSSLLALIDGSTTFTFTNINEAVDIVYDETLDLWRIF